MKNEEFVMRHHCAAKFFILSHLFKLLFAERRLHNHSFQLTSPHVNADFRTDLAVFGSDIPHSDTNLTGRRHSSGGNHTDGNTVCTIQLVTMTGDTAVYHLKSHQLTGSAFRFLLFQHRAIGEVLSLHKLGNPT